MRMKFLTDGFGGGSAAVDAESILDSMEARGTGDGEGAAAVALEVEAGGAGEAGADPAGDAAAAPGEATGAALDPAQEYRVGNQILTGAQILEERAQLASAQGAREWQENFNACMEDPEELETLIAGLQERKAALSGSVVAPSVGFPSLAELDDDSTFEDYGPGVELLRKAVREMGPHLGAVASLKAEVAQLRKIVAEGFTDLTPVIETARMSKQESAEITSASAAADRPVTREEIARAKELFPGKSVEVAVVRMLAGAKAVAKPASAAIAGSGRSTEPPVLTKGMTAEQIVDYQMRTRKA